MIQNILLSLALLLWVSRANTGYEVVDETCGVIDSQVILYSQIKHRAQQENISFEQAQNQLKCRAFLWLYAKDKPQFNTAAIYKQAQSHAEKVMQTNGLTIESFNRILNGPPYYTTYTQYLADTASIYLEGLIKSFLGEQIAVNDQALQSETTKKSLDLKANYDIFIVNIVVENRINKSGHKLNNDYLNAQFKKANEIRDQITTQSTINDIKTRYKQDKEVSISGPLGKGELKDYEDLLQKNPNMKVSEPFKDGNAVALIWKMAKAKTESSDEKALLEKVRKEHYETAAIEKQLNTIINTMMDESTFVIKDCKMSR